MPPWLIPFCLFFVLAAVFLGGTTLRIEGGGGPRQVLGLLLSLVLYMVVWSVLRLALQQLMPSAWHLVPSTVLGAGLLPAEVWLAYRILGVRLARGAAQEAHAPGHG